ncbi:MAG: MTH938/NDUFAF3 family protein [Candidatus Bathyarchaeia archaeon]
MIDSYDFGVIIIDGKRYTSNVIIFIDEVMSGWWRKEGHRIHLEDLKEVFDHKPPPEVLVVGTDYYGLVKVMPEVNDALKERGIKLITQPTGEAYKTFNELLKAGKLVADAFHLTC